MSDVAIEVRGLSIGWGTTVLQENASFDAHIGEVLAVLGGSGCGKSTLLRFLIGLEQPLAGTIRMPGIGDPSFSERPPFGVMFQAGALFGSMSVLDNVALPMKEWTDLPADAIAAIALAKLRLVGLESAAGKNPSEISGGMRKRAAIARALALEPSLLFLDEPSAGLDPVTSAELDELIITLKKVLGVTIVIVSHELASIHAVADRCIMLDKATRSIIARGSPRELAESSDPRVSDFFNRKPRAA